MGRGGGTFATPTENLAQAIGYLQDAIGKLNAVDGMLGAMKNIGENTACQRLRESTDKLKSALNALQSIPADKIGERKTS